MLLKSHLPLVYEQLLQAGAIAERYLRDLAEIEFEFQDGQAYVLQVRKGKRTPLADIRLQLQFLAEGMIAFEEFLGRIRPGNVAAILGPEITDVIRLKPLGKGLPAGVGAASGRIVFWPPRRERIGLLKGPYLLVMREWHGEDTRLIDASVGVLATIGGVSSHAALACRQMGKPGVVGFRQGMISRQEEALLVPGFAPLREGDWLTIDGMAGEVYAGRAKIVTKAWEAHPELLQLSLIIEKAVSSGHVPPTCAGPVWRIWDFMRHGLPLAQERIALPAAKDQPRRPSVPDVDSAATARQKMSPVEIALQEHYSEIIHGLMTTLERLFRSSRHRKPSRCCRLLWDPARQLRSQECSQLVGFEFVGINQHIPHLIEISSLRFHLDCEVQSPSEAWAVQPVPGFGIRMIPGARTIKACRITVNGAELGHEDVPVFYSWLRRREYFWHWYEEHQTSHAEIAAFLERFARTGKHDPKLSVLCYELGLIRQNGLTAAGRSLAALNPAPRRAC